MFRFLWPALLLTASAFAQIPFFEASRVQIPNSAETTPLGPGELISVYGANLGPDDPCQGHADPDLRETPNPQRPNPAWNNLLVFPKELCGVRVLVGGVPAGLLYVHRHQINFKAPQNVPMDGTVGLQIVYGGLASEVVQIAAGIAPVRLILLEPAFTDMPIWVRVVIPPNRGPDIRYPYGVGPGYIGCNELEVRRAGRLLQKIPASAARNGIGSGPACGSMAQDDRYNGRLPLHLLYRFDEPGDYEVRLTLTHRRYRPSREEIVFRTEWTPFVVAPSSENQRIEWLAAITRDPPDDKWEVVSDYLPNILGVPDAQSLDAVLDQLYHPDHIVRRYAELALSYWPQQARLEPAQKVFERRGPSDALMRQLLDARQQTADPRPLVEGSLPYLQSDNAVLQRGAVQAVVSMRWRGLAASEPELAAKAAAAMIAASDSIIATADEQTVWDYAAELGWLKDPSALPLLRKWLEEQRAIPTVIRSITEFAQPEDLPRLAALLTVRNADRDYYQEISLLPEYLYEAYGARSIVYLERVLRESDSAALKVSCTQALLHADHPQAWQFAVKEIESNGRYKDQLLTAVHVLYPQDTADETAILALARQHASMPKP
jgi:hypothetical protein